MNLSFLQIAILIIIIGIMLILAISVIGNFVIEYRKIGITKNVIKELNISMEDFHKFLKESD